MENKGKTTGIRYDAGIAVGFATSAQTRIGQMDETGNTRETSRELCQGRRR